MHDQHIPVINKFTLLRDCLEGTAQRIIGGLALVDGNYSVAITMIKHRNGYAVVIKQIHVKFLLNNKLAINELSTKDQGETYIESLWNYYDEYLANIVSLGTFGVQGDYANVFVCKMILRG